MTAKSTAILLPLLIGAMLVACLIYLQGSGPSAPSSNQGATPAAGRTVTLYFGTPDGLHLAGEGRRIDCSDEAGCVRGTVQALLAGPSSAALVPLLPRNGGLRGVVLQDGTAQVDLTAETLNGHPGGSLTEWLTLMGLTNTLTSNFPAIRQVVVLTNGGPRDSLDGHADLRLPLVADYSLIEGSTAAVPRTPGR